MGVAKNKLPPSLQDAAKEVNTQELDVEELNVTSAVLMVQFITMVATAKQRMMLLCSVGQKAKIQENV